MRETLGRGHDGGVHGVTHFFTGSRVYGTPRRGSDLDLVLLVDEGEVAELLAVTQDTFHDSSNYPGKTSKPFQFGQMNVIACYTREVYDAWREARDRCVALKATAGRPISRDEAVATHTQVFRERGLYDHRVEPAPGCGST